MKRRDFSKLFASLPFVAGALLKNRADLESEAEIT